MDNKIPLLDVDIEIEFKVFNTYPYIKKTTLLTLVF